MNRLITVNSYTMLASTLMFAIGKKLMMLMTALLVSQHGKKTPAGLRLVRPGPLVSRADLTQPLHSAVVGEGACSLLLTHHLQAVSLSRSDAVPRLVHLRQRFAHPSPWWG